MSTLDILLFVVMFIWLGVVLGLRFLTRRSPVAERRKRHLMSLIISGFFATAVFYLEFGLTPSFFLMSLLFVASAVFVYRWVQFCSHCGSPTRMFLFSPVPTHCPACGHKLDASAHP
jgi:hypothetical protein